MQNFPVTENEAARLKALYEYDILDSISEQEYDWITVIASQICGTQASMITLIDKNRQWIKSSFGYEIKETPREISFCNYTIMDPDNVNVVPDLRLDERYNSNPLVTGEPHAVFYAGAPLVTEQGFVLGSICVLDDHVKELTPQQELALKSLAHQIITTLELRKTNKKLKQAQHRLRQSNKSLREFAKLVSHDMKTPLANITMLSKGFRSTYKKSLDEGADGYIELIQRSATEMICFLDRMLENTDNAFTEMHAKKPVDSYVILNRVLKLLATPPDFEINIKGDFPSLAVDETLLQQVFQNLISNAIKYNDKPKGVINISAERDHKYHYLHISDNGSGIDSSDLETIFKKNKTLNKTDRYGNKGTGIGLAKVKSIIESAGGKITVTSTLNAGSEFRVCFPN